MGCPRSPLLQVPTCMLVSQQAEAIRSWVPHMRVQEYMGGLAPPYAGSFDVLVATPKAFQMQQQLGGTQVTPDFRFFCQECQNVTHVTPDFRCFLSGVSECHSCDP